MIRHVALALAIGLGSLAGCHSPELEKRWQRRAENRAKAWDAYIKVEQRAPDGFNKAVAVAMEQHRRDIANTQANPARIEAALKAEIDRANERAPIYLERAGKELAGDPANAIRTVPDVIE